MLISIVYHSGYGNTAKRAQAVVEGVRKVSGVESNLIAVADGPIQPIAEIAHQFNQHSLIFAEAGGDSELRP
jgi:multimeric flavodoxin WrbA